MRINSINLYNNQISYYSNKTSSNNHRDQKQSSNDYSYEVVSYPRRYLPGYYPNVSVKQTYDSFTKLRDKNYLLNVLEGLMTDCKKTGKEFSIGMFDMDNFKSVNELLGYKTGDDFIKEISNIISDTAKQNFLHAYRYGGEEFVVVFDKDHSPTDRAKIAQDIVDKITANHYIDSKSEQYKQNAQIRLDEYIALSSKVSELIPLKSKRDLLRELQFNFETKEARNDSYLQKCIKEVNFEIKKLYLQLINARIREEDSVETIENLKKARNKIAANILLDENQVNMLDEYLLSIYDKTFEIHQIKKWIKDFESSGGFSITGGIVTFDKASLQDKTPIDIVNEAGEVLKQGKNIHKGRKYLS